LPARFVFLLHSHMPYVRRNGDWPCGEEWILEAWAESYLPFWELISDLSSAKRPGRLAITLTPVLAEQLEDDYLQERLSGYLANKVRQAQEQAKTLEGRGEEERARVAAFYAERYSCLLQIYETRFRGRMMETLSRGMASGKLEVLTSAATHALLPSLGEEACRRAQVRIGVESFRDRFHEEPSGFWLPECAYTPELDGLLSGFSPPLRYIVLDHTVDGTTWRPRRLGSTPLIALLRDRIAHEMVWTVRGIPSHGAYRDYSKRDHQGHGFQYWRITSVDAPIENKALYDPRKAGRQAAEDARWFAAKLRERAASTGDDDALILSCYDMELLGHWWLEGPAWLADVLSLFGDDCALPGEAAQLQAGTPPVAPSLTAWNVDDGFHTWINPGTAWLWENVLEAEGEFLAALRDAGAREKEALLQAGRELLLLESSDWSYMMTRGQAAEYARQRFASHLHRFRKSIDMARTRGIDRRALDEVEDADNLFPGLEPESWR
jgi:1,4-alpha-glucan branching enzyme